MLRVLIGSLLLAAAALKGWQLATAPLPPDSLLPRPVWAMLVEGELLLALWLLCGGLARLDWAACVGLFSLFATFTLYQLTIGAESCGCFGQVRVPPAVTLALDLAILAALFFCRPTVSESTPAWRLGVPLWILALVGPPAALAMTSYTPGSLESGGVVVLEPQTWDGEPFPLTEHVDLPADLSEGRWTVVFYRHNCGKCLAELPDYHRRAAAGERIALISVPPHAADRLAGQSAAAAVAGRLSDSRDWFIQTPAAVTLVDGVVTTGTPIAVASSNQEDSK